MSASREKKGRQDLSAQGPSEKNMKQQREEQAAKRSRILYTILGVVFGVAAIALLVYNTGFFQSRATAVTIDGQKFTAADLEFHYQMVYNQEYINSLYGQSNFNYAQSPEDQIYDELNMTTWHAHFVDEAQKSLAQHVALEKAAKAEGYTLSEEGQKTLADTLAGLEDQWRGSLNYTSRAGYLKAVYGPYMTYDVYKTNLERSIYVEAYTSDYVNSLEFSLEEQEAYYKEHADELDAFTLTQFVFQASLPAAETDADGNTIERTEEEEAQLLEQAKQEAKANADAVYAALQANPNQNLESLSEQYNAYSFLQDDVRLGSGVNDAYQEWAYDSARKSGDLYQAEYESFGTYNYCVVRFEDRQRDETPSADVRHILVAAAESGQTPTQEQFDEAKTKAQELLDQWKAGEATEDSFAELAREHSADTGSASNGGLISAITPYSNYVDTFTDWALDPARKIGDTELVQNTGSPVQGWHVMYLSDQGDPYWMLEAQYYLSNEAEKAWMDERTENVKPEPGSGLKYV